MQWVKPKLVVRHAGIPAMPHTTRLTHARYKKPAQVGT
jgi:hypothetical protein